MKIRQGLLAAVLVVSLVVVGCARTEYVPVPVTVTAMPTQEQPSQRPTRSVPTTQPLTVRGSCAVGEIAANGGCVPCEKLKPCYLSADEMHLMVEKLFPQVYEFARTQYDASISQVEWRVVFSGQYDYGSCGHKYAGSLPDYCSGDGRIYLGEDALWSIYQMGDYGPQLALVVMSHEYAHHIQMRLGSIGHPGSAQDREQIEKQADCLSGSAAKYYIEHGYAPASLPTILKERLPAIVAIAQSSSGPHGTFEERIDAFNQGMKGLSNCNALGVGSITS